MNGFVLEHEVTGPLHTNCYLLYDKESKEAALFDVGGKINKLISIIEKENLKIKYFFFTHLHFDHFNGINKIKKKFPEALIAYNKNELFVLENQGFFARIFQVDSSIIENLDLEVEDKQTLRIGNIEVKTILAPGHTPGSICYYFNGCILTGDVLFRSGIGRTDLYGGSYEILLTSISKLMKFPDDTKVYPGHGDFTDIGTEKRENPFIVSGDILM